MFFVSSFPSLGSHMSSCQGLSPRILQGRGFQTLWTLIRRKKHILCCDTEHTLIYQTATAKQRSCQVQGPIPPELPAHSSPCGQTSVIAICKRKKPRHGEHSGLTSVAQCTWQKKVQLGLVWLQGLGSEPQTKAKIPQLILISLCEI